MRNWLMCALLAFAVPSIAAADKIEFVSGTATAIQTGSGTTTSFSNSNFDGWDILFAFGSNNSPGLTPTGIDLSVQATCAGGTALCVSNPLDVFYTAQGFNVSVPAGGFQTTYSATDSGGSTRAITWADSTNTLFGGGLPTGIGTDHLGTVGPFTGSGGFGSVSGGPAEVSPYSLTIEDIFTAGANATS